VKAAKRLIVFFTRISRNGSLYRLYDLSVTVILLRSNLRTI
jgi:hypothetical protein